MRQETDRSDITTTEETIEEIKECRKREKEWHKLGYYDPYAPPLHQNIRNNYSGSNSKKE